MSPGSNDIRTLETAIREEAEAEARQILAEARAQIEGIRAQAQSQADTKREAVVRRAREQADALREHTVAAAQLEAQALKLKRREHLLDRVFAEAGRRLLSVSQQPDYEQIARRLVCEAVERLGADEVIVRADAATRKVLSDEVLAEMEKELSVRLKAGEPLAQSSGVVIETPDGHRRYDNTFETRLARMHDTLRTPVYHILMGETP